MTDTTRKGIVGGLPESTLHDRVYEIFGTCYSPEAAPNGDVKESATQDVLRIIEQARAEERARIVGEVEKYNDEQISTAIRGDEYRDGFDHAFGGIWEILSSLDKSVNIKE